MASTLLMEDTLFGPGIGLNYSAGAGEGFLWQGKLRFLLRPDDPGVGVDGYLSPAELAEHVQTAVKA